MTKDRQCVLVVEDQKINRELLKIILQQEYDVLEAENGAVAFDVLHSHAEIAAILLDIVMPVMDGYTFLEKLRVSPYLSIPTIVMTGEKNEHTEQKTLDLGAWDFVSKPYQPATLMTRLKNVIVRSEYYLLNEMKQLYERDPLTGLYNRSHFFKETKKLLDQNPGVQFALIRMDIDHFQNYNAFWGEEEGDKLLRYIADNLLAVPYAGDYKTVARINADIFCICIPYSQETVDRIAGNAYKNLAKYNPEFSIVPSFGVYVIDDRSESIQKMYENVTLAAKECKGSYMKYISRYTPEMSQKMLKNQWIVNEMQHALDSGQFEVYLQPKYNLRTDTPYGAEALIRWYHPEKGLLPPGSFIPVFEQNGFIRKVDYFVWEKAVQLLRKWRDEGRNTGTISVNVSRINMYNPNLVNSLTELVERYGIPPELLHLEVTESAYMDNPSVMEKIIEDLQKAGFVILMDDFGSGYSSLNTLKDIHVNVLKIDMKFLSDDSGSARSRSILASAIRMAGWLDTPVIMEGVETADQVAFLRSIGCNYAQGYYYARPMPVGQYEKLMADIKMEPVAQPPENLPEINEILWVSSPGSEFLFESMIIPAAIYQIEKDNIQILRINESFSNLFVNRYGTMDRLDISLQSSLAQESIPDIKRAFYEAAEGRKSTFCDFIAVDSDGGEQMVKMRLRYWGMNQTAQVIFAQFIPSGGNSWL